MHVQTGHPLLAEYLMDGRYTRRIYAEGDSWFSAGGFLNGNLLDALDIRHPEWLFVSSAYPGDELIEVAELAAGEYQWMLQPTDGVPRWDALLLSGGGNDMLGNAASLVDADGIVHAAVHKKLKAIATSMDVMIGIAREAQPGIPVFVNCYDYPWPTSNDAPWIFGPWIGPAFRKAGLPVERWHACAAELVDALHAALTEVAQKYRGVFLVDNRGSLERPKNNWWAPITGDWANEIHPSGRGYYKHALQWDAAMQRTFSTEH